MNGAPDSKERQSDESKDAAGQSRSELKLERLLSSAAALIAKHGYGQTTIRDVARETGYSLAGMYYYFENKEDLLFQIQQRTFTSLLAEQERAAGEAVDAGEKLRRLVRNHLSYFTRHTGEMKVCAFEMHSLNQDRYRVIETLRRQYYRCMVSVIGEILGVDGEQALSSGTTRHHALFIFGMLNWIFMWYDPERDGPAEQLGEEMIDLVLHGLPGAQSSADLDSQ